MTDRRELPLRIDLVDGQPVIRALCGAEAALIDPSRRLPGIRHSQPDASPAALVRMVLHVKGCQACQYQALEEDNQRAQQTWASSGQQAHLPL